MKRRILATFLSICLFVGILPTVALADGPLTSNFQGLAISCAEGSEDHHVTVNGESKDGVSTRQVANFTSNGSPKTFTMPEVGFEVRITPHQGSQTESVYSDGQTLEVDLEYFVSAYIKPYIDVEIPPQRPLEKHVYYTFELHNVIDSEMKDNEGNLIEGKGTFGTKKIYNTSNTVSKDWIVANELSDERLDTSYYEIVVTAYNSDPVGVENPESDQKLGTATSKIYVRMIKPDLDWLDSYFWAEYFIDSDLGTFYDTPEELISQYLGEYDSTIGCDEPENNWLDDIPVTWELKSGTVWSTEPGGENVLTWTAHLDKAPEISLWEVPADFDLSEDVVFRNPFAVTFRDGETVLKTEYRKNGTKFLVADFPPVPQKTGYTSRWSVETDLTVTANTEITAVHTPTEYPITYELNGGTNAPENPTSYTVEDTISLKAPTRDNYIFVGWTYPGQDTPQKDVTIPAGTLTGDLTFTAHWQEDSSGGGTHYSYTLRYDTNGGEAIQSESKSLSWTKKYEDLPIPERDGYTFEGGYLDSGLTDLVEEDVKVNRSLITLYASWSEDLSDPDNNGVSDWLNTKDHSAYLAGYDDGTFGPDRNMTRAEAAQVFYNLLLDKDVPVTVSFSDVPDDAWYATAVNTLASLGIVSGIGDGQFAPNRPITRAEFTVIAMHFTNGTTEGENIFSDVSPKDWFYDQVVGSIQYGWIIGYSDGTFRPKNSITRAEVTTIVNHMLGRSADVSFVDHHLDELRSFQDVLSGHWAYYQIAEATNTHDYKKDSAGEEWVNIQ